MGHACTVPFIPSSGFHGEVENRTLSTCLYRNRFSRHTYVQLLVVPQQKKTNTFAERFQASESSDTVPLQSSCRTFFHGIIVYVASVCKRRATETRTELQFSLGNGCLDMSWVLMVWTPATTLWSSSATASFWSPSSSRTATLRVFSLIRSEGVRFKWAPSAGNGRGWCTQILTTIMVWVAKGKSRGATMWRTSTRVNPPWD